MPPSWHSLQLCVRTEDCREFVYDYPSLYTGIPSTQNVPLKLQSPLNFPKQTAQNLWYLVNTKCHDFVFNLIVMIEYWKPSMKNGRIKESVYLVQMSEFMMKISS